MRAGLPAHTKGPCFACTSRTRATDVDAGCGRVGWGGGEDECGAAGANKNPPPDRLDDWLRSPVQGHSRRSDQCVVATACRHTRVCCAPPRAGIPREQGLLSFWRGNGTNVIRIIPVARCVPGRAPDTCRIAYASIGSLSIKFATYDQFKLLTMPRGESAYKVRWALKSQPRQPLPVAYTRAHATVLRAAICFAVRWQPVVQAACALR